MRVNMFVTGGLALAGILVLGCGPDGGQEGAELRTDAGGEDVEASATEAPDTIAEALWGYLQEQDYRTAWSLWPGKGRLYEGTEPHGMLLTTYANDVAYDALLQGGAADLPPGAILVKENYMPDSTFAGATVMQKVAGYNPEHQDWLFAKYTPEGGIDAFGRAPMCQACHQQAESGYVYTPVGQP